MERIKEKKIGVKFQKVLTKRYCYLTYNGMNTRFPFSVDESKSYNSDEDEIEWIRESLRIVIKNVKHFQLKGIKNSLLRIWHPLESFEQLYDSVLSNLGDSLSHNDFQKIFLDKDAEQFDSASEFVNFLSETYLLSKLSSPSTNNIVSLLDTLNEKDFENAVIRLALMEFQDKEKVCLKNWIEDFDGKLRSLSNYNFSDNFRIEKLSTKNLEPSISKKIVANLIDSNLFVLGVFQDY